MPGDEDSSTADDPDIRRVAVLEQLTVLLFFKAYGVLDSYKNYLDAKTRDIETGRQGRLFSTVVKTVWPAVKEYVPLWLAAAVAAALYFWGSLTLVLSALWSAFQAIGWAIEKFPDLGLVSRFF